MNSYKITKQGHALIETAVKGDWPSCPQDKKADEWKGILNGRLDMANDLIKIEESSEEGTFSYLDYSDLRATGVQPLHLRVLVREKLLEKLVTDDEKREPEPSGPVLGFLYEMDVQKQIEDIETELSPYEISHKHPPIELLRRLQTLKRDISRLTGRGGFPF